MAHLQPFKRLDKHRFSVDKQLGLSLHELENKVPDPNANSNSSIQCKIGFGGSRKRSQSKHARKFGNEKEEEF